MLGLVDAKVWNRQGRQGRGSPLARDRDKESQRWLDGTTRAGEVLAAAKSITGVSDRESDIYEHFARRPDNTHLIVRACQNRKIETMMDDQGTLLFQSSTACPKRVGSR